MVLFDKTPKVTIATAAEVKDMFDWDLSEIVTAATAKQIILDKEDEIRNLEASELEIVLNPKENITITAPEKGENITKNEYTSNIRKKMVEMRDNRMGRRSR